MAKAADVLGINFMIRSHRIFVLLLLQNVSLSSFGHCFLKRQALLLALERGWITSLATHAKKGVIRAHATRCQQIVTGVRKECSVTPVHSMAS